MSEVSLACRVVARDNVLSREIEGETVLLSLTRSEYFGLNATGTRVWQLLQQPCTVRGVCERMAAEFDAAPEVVERDVVAVIGSLIAHDLVHVVPD